MSMGGGWMLPAWALGLGLLFSAWPTLKLLCVVGMVVCVANALAGGWRVQTVIPITIAILFALLLLALSKRQTRRAPTRLAT